MALTDADLTTIPGLRDAIAAAKELQAVMNAQIHPALVRLKAIQEQRRRFEKWKAKFSLILYRHLNNLFIHMVCYQEFVNKLFICILNVIWYIKGEY